MDFYLFVSVSRPQAIWVPLERHESLAVGEDDHRLVLVGDDLTASVLEHAVTDEVCSVAWGDYHVVQGDGTAVDFEVFLAGEL